MSDATRDATSGRLARIRHSRLAGLLRDARREDLGVHLLALSAQQLLCTVPLAVALAALARRAVGLSTADVLTKVLQLDPVARQAVTASFAGSDRVSALALWTNLLIAVVFAIGLAATLQRGLEMVWHRPRARAAAGFRRQVVWALAVAVLIVVVVAIGRAGHAGSPDSGLLITLGVVGQIVVVGLFAWWTQWLLLARRESWRQLWPSAALFVSAVTVLLFAARVFISGELVSSYEAYGAVGVVIILSAWVAVTSSVSMAGLTLGCWLRRLRPLSVR